MTHPTQELSDILRRTAAVIAAEPLLPRSPGVVHDERLVLCAGAAVVYQTAVMTRSASESNQIAYNMIYGGKEQIVREAEAVELDPAFVRQLIINNDSLDDHERRDQIVELLATLADGMVVETTASRA